MRFPFKRQLDNADCGPACIQMIAAYYGKNVSLSRLKEYCHVTRLGISLKDVIDGCQQIGLKAIAVHIGYQKVRQMPLPAILYWKQEHYVVLYQIEQKKDNTLFYIADPDFGKTKLEESLFLDTWALDNQQGVGIVIEPTSTFFELPQEKQTIKSKVGKYFSTFKYLSEHKRNLVFLLLLSAATFVCSLLIPILLQKIIDDGVGLKNINTVVLLLMAQLSLFVGSQLSAIVNNYILYKTGLKVGMKISTQYIYKLVRLPIHFFDTKLGTDLLQRLNDEDKIRNFLTYTVSSLLFVVLNLLIYSCILIHYNWYVFIIFLLFSTVSIGLTQIILRVRKRLNYTLFSGWSKKKNIENELVYGMMDIKMNAAHNLFLLQWTKLQNTINSQLLKSLYYESGISSGTSFFNTLRDVLITGGCALFVIKGEMSIGVMMTITYILGQLSGTISQAVNYGKTSQDSNLAYTRIEEILNIPNENDGKQVEDMRIQEQGFALRNLSFKYEGSFNPYVLNEISVDIPLHRVTAVVGASGSGKTTLLKLLLSFYYPQKGSLSLGGISMNRLNTDEWRKRCGAVMQDGYIFSGTIAANIALAEETPELARLKQAARIACIDEFIERLPMQYYTKIGKAGVDLSGGQKQRILIARAVYKNPEFIFFDEATSSLDATNEKEIMGNLKEFYKNKTVVIIAHRLSTVKDADNIIVLDNGFVVEQGSHTDLTTRKGKYYHLVKNQLELG
ncbi:peptidase domain-containing ABC transporter [Bacteroides fragilis]|jgi:ATP-binding cassette subfamily B protein|nr:peptidase domain-containing ABC transporter [Bacteroides fragilis]